MLHRLADAEFGCSLFTWSMIVALTDDHVAAVTVTPIEVPSAGRAFTNRRDHFEKLIANREHRVLKSERFHRRVTKSNLKAKHVSDILDNRSQLPGYQGNLSYAKPHRKSPF